MSQAERDCALIEHLATKVMGWHDWVAASMYGWNPLEGPSAGNEAMELWERARAVYPEWGIKLETLAGGSGYGAYIWRPFEKDGKNTLIQSSSGTRAIAEAVALATGYKREEPK